jgi:hypothetical protein
MENASCGLVEKNSKKVQMMVDTKSEDVIQSIHSPLSKSDENNN